MTAAKGMGTMWRELAGGGDERVDRVQEEAALLWVRRELARVDDEILDYVRRWEAPTPDALDRRVESGRLDPDEDVKVAADAAGAWRWVEARRKRLLYIAASLTERGVGTQPRVVEGKWHELVSRHVDVPTAGMGAGPRVGEARVPLSEVLSAAFDDGGRDRVRARYPGLTVEDIAAAELFARRALEDGGALARGLQAEVRNEGAKGRGPGE